MSAPTPRTDSEEYPDGEGQSFHVVSADFARTLETELTALTAERDQLRFENSNLRAGQKACEACDEPMAFEVQQLLARAERAEADAERYRLAWQILSKVVAKLRAEVERLRSDRAAIDAGMKEGA